MDLKEKEEIEEEKAQKKIQMEEDQKKVEFQIKQEIQGEWESNPEIKMAGKVTEMTIDLTVNEDVEGPTARWQNR